MQRSSAAIRTVRAAAAVAALLGAAAAPALEWRNTPGLALGAGYDSNIELLPANPRGVSNATLTAGTEVVGRDEQLQLRFKPELRSVGYDDERELDRTDAFADLSIRMSHARQSWSLGGSYSLESTLTSEFEGTGFVAADIDRAATSWNAGWVHAAGDRGSVQLSALASKVDYGEAPFSPFVDYQYDIAQAGYSLAAERSTWSFDASRSLLDNDSSGAETESRSLGASWSRRFSEVLRGSVGVGVFEVSSGGRFGADTSGVSYEFSVQRDFDRWTFNASGARELQPEGRGTLVREDGVNLAVLRRLTARASVALALRVAQAAEPGPLEDLVERTYSRANVEVNWRLAERWTLHGTVGARAQDMPFQERATGRGVMLTAGYRGK